MSLLTVGAMLPKDWEIHYVDLAYESVQEWTYDMVFMSPSTTQSQEAYGYACQFRDRGARIVMGGPHASVCPDEVLQYADVVFAGEAEDTMRQFLREWSSSSEKNVSSFDTSRSLGNRPSRYIL
ncbi:MAG: cobalamin-dependent protein [Clostridia bacterium]